MTPTISKTMPSRVRRKWSTEDKLRLVEETLVPGSSITLVAEKYGLHKNQLSLWRQLAAKGALHILDLEKRLADSAQSLALLTKIREGKTVKGRRGWSKAEKVEIVLETYNSGMTVRRVARRYGVNPNQLSHWRRQVADDVFVENRSRNTDRIDKVKSKKDHVIEKRRYWSKDEKSKIVAESFHGKSSVSNVSRKYDINPSQLFRWRLLFKP